MAPPAQSAAPDPAHFDLGKGLPTNKAAAPSSLPIEPAQPERAAPAQLHEPFQQKPALPNQMLLPKAHPPTFHRRKISLVTDSSYTASSPKPSPRQKTIVPRLHLDEMQTLQKKKLATPAARLQGKTPQSRLDRESTAKRGSARRHEPYKNL